jgi:hypothetical protein
MTEELEKKLNELLELKKQLEEITEEKQKAATSLIFEQYKRKDRLVSIFFWGRYVIGMALVVIGAIAMNRMSYIQIDPFTIVMAGFVIAMVANLGLLISRSKLAILQEMKQFELRITEILKK